jgi:uncharacterized membrane-anchored protein YhcB (DUF1043 family)
LHCTQKQQIDGLQTDLLECTMKYSEELDNYTQELAKHVKTSQSKLDAIQQHSTSLITNMQPVALSHADVSICLARGVG